MVLPFTFVQGGSWNKARNLLESQYGNIHILSITANSSLEKSFSADTGIAECLVVATRQHKSTTHAAFSNLTARPNSLLQAAITAKDAWRHATRGDLLSAGNAGSQSAEISNMVQHLQAGRLFLPRMTQPVQIPITRLKAVADRGFYHTKFMSGYGGYFDVRDFRSGEIPTYPILWSHDADRERRFVVEPDRSCDVCSGFIQKAVDVWTKTASRLHSNRDFRLNSQSLAMCLTPEKSLGGRAWPNVIPHESRFEIPLLLWANSTLGLVLFWWHSTRQQNGRSNLTISKLPDLPVLDTRTLTAGQIEHCRAIFDKLKNEDFRPANEAYCDDVRKDLDSDLLFGVTSVLKLDPSLEEGLDLLRKQWCAEPSVHGGKSTRIKAGKR